MKKKNRIHFNFNEWGILYALILFWLILFLFRPNFQKWSAFQNILRESALAGICGVGMTFAIISGDFDLSVASQVAVSSVILTLIMPITGVLPAILIILVAGMVMGTVNGLLIAKLRIPSFIATLAMMYGYRALAQLINSTPVSVENEAFRRMATSYILGIPIPFLIMVICALIGTLILRKTTFGRHVLAIGNSRQAAEISGINIGNTQLMIYILVGLFTAAAAIVITSYRGSSNYGMNMGFEFTVITAVVIGGTALAGGKGSIFTTAVAAIFLASIKSGMDAFRIDSYYQRIIEGVILIFAFSINTIREVGQDVIKTRRAKKAQRADQAPS